MRPLQFIGVKIVDATPMTREAFEAQEGRNVGGDKHGDGYMVTYEGGYRAWSPKDVFDAAYRPINAMTFGLAIEALKLGKKVTRAGWNGKGMRLKLVPNGYFDVGISIVEEQTKLLPWIGMKTADSRFVPWIGSQTDMLAEDWQVVA